MRSEGSFSTFWFRLELFITRASLPMAQAIKLTTLNPTQIEPQKGGAPAIWPSTALIRFC